MKKIATIPLISTAIFCICVALVGLFSLGGSGRSTIFGGAQEQSEDAQQAQREADSRVVAAAADGNWGLSFQKEGSAPVGNATPEYLADYNAFYLAPGDSSEKKLYLTFDAGYENGVTEKLLDVLKEEKVPAAFFVVGNFIDMWSAITPCTTRICLPSRQKMLLKKSLRNWRTRTGKRPERK